MQKNDIVVIYGNEYIKNVKSLLSFIKLEEMVKNKDSKIIIKPNLVLSQNPDLGATTHTEFIIAIIEYLQEKGFYNIKVVESSWYGTSTKIAFRDNGYYKLSAKYNVPLVDVKDDQYKTVSENGITMEISKEIMDCDFLISVPVLKGHCQAKVTCALKNMKGCLSDRSKRMFHSLGLMKPIATLNKIKAVDLIIVDSINGDLDFEEGGNPVVTNRIFASIDSVLCDSYGASLMGYDVEEIKYLKLAEDYGVGSSDIKNANIINLNEPESINYSKIKPTREVANLSKYIEANSACSVCYGNLIHAIKRLRETNSLNNIDKVCIGQGYKKINNESLIGVGSCTRKLGKSLKGCPPSAKEMIEFLKDL